MDEKTIEAVAARLGIPAHAIRAAVRLGIQEGDTIIYGRRQAIFSTRDTRPIVAELERGMIEAAQTTDGPKSE